MKEECCWIIRSSNHMIYHCTLNDEAWWIDKKQQFLCRMGSLGTSPYIQSKYDCFIRCVISCLNDVYLMYFVYLCTKSVSQSQYTVYGFIFHFHLDKVDCFTASFLFEVLFFSVFSRSEILFFSVFSPIFRRFFSVFWKISTWQPGFRWIL